MAYLLIFIKESFIYITMTISHSSTLYMRMCEARWWYSVILSRQFYFFPSIFSKNWKSLQWSSSRNLWSFKILTESPLEIRSLPHKWFLVLWASCLLHNILDPLGSKKMQKWVTLQSKVRFISPDFRHPQCGCPTSRLMNGGHFYNLYKRICASGMQFLSL